MDHDILDAQMSALEFSLQTMPEKVKGPGKLKSLCLAEQVRRSGHSDLATRAEKFITAVSGPEGLATLKGEESSKGAKK